MKRIIAAALFGSLALAPAFAQSNHSGHGAAPTAQGASPSNDAYAKANAKMHRDMSVKLTGNADRDFVQGMIPHHQGAVDMARIVLQYGKDPEIKKMAEEIIAAQEKEIAMFRTWLAKQPK